MTSPKFDLATELEKGGLPRMAQAIASLFCELRPSWSGSVWLASLSAATPPANVEQPATALAELRQVEGTTGANAAPECTCDPDDVGPMAHSDECPCFVKPAWANAERPTCPECQRPLFKVSGAWKCLVHSNALDAFMLPTRDDLIAERRTARREYAELECKLSTSEARVRELEETLGDSSESSDATSDVHVFPAGTPEAMRDARLRREIFDCVKQHPTKPKIATWQYGKALRLISDYRHELSRELSDTRAQLLAEQARGRGLENEVAKAEEDYRGLVDFSNCDQDKTLQQLYAAEETERRLTANNHDLARRLEANRSELCKRDAVVEAARVIERDYLNPCGRAPCVQVLRATLAALDASSKPDAPAPIAEPEPAERPIVVGSTWVQDMPPGMHVNVTISDADSIEFRWRRDLRRESCPARDFRLWFRHVSDPVPSEPSE